jgi:RNA polymerase sigma factor for flagellar operon FliA
MSDRHPDAEALFFKHLDVINRLAAIMCARHGIRGADAEDLAAWVRIKLMEDDYAVLRRFQGRSELRTYLAAVVARYVVSYLRQMKGEWRTSAAAERLGAPAIDLERLVLRDGYTVQQAGEVLRTAGRTTLSDAELARLVAALPSRTPLRPEEPQPSVVLNSAPGRSRADERIVAAESDARRTVLIDALGQALGDLEPEEQLIVMLHFGDGHSVAEVARALHLEQKPLYRRVERLRNRLRAALEGAGLREDEVRNLLFESESL